MNPAGLKVHLEELKENGILIINTDNFTPKNLSLQIGKLIQLKMKNFG